MDDFGTNRTNVFGLSPSPANYISPGKRPLSSMCPSIILDKNDDALLLVGSAGGSRITTSVAYVSCIDFVTSSRFFTKFHLSFITDYNKPPLAKSYSIRVDKETSCSSSIVTDASVL